MSDEDQIEPITRTTYLADEQADQEPQDT